MANVRWALLAFLLCAVAACGIEIGVSIGPLSGSSSGMLHLLIPLTMCIASVWCCALDGRVRQGPVPHGVQLMMMPVWPLAVFVYLIWSRGWKGAVFGILFTILSVSVYCVAAGAAYTLTLAIQ